MFPKSSRLTFILLIVIFLEGYIVLASELLAIRQLNGFVGSGADTVSIIIAAVLMPLAFGYYVGGRYKPQVDAKGKFISIRHKLIRNIFISFFFLVVALTNFGVEMFFLGLFQMGVGDRFLLTSIYSIIFLVTPVFLLGQTVPLICNYFSKKRLAQITGKILFISTLGSFLGSILTTIVIMHYFGVNNAVNFIFVLLAGLIFVLSKKMVTTKTIVMTVILAIALLINSTATLQKLGIVSSNAYNTAIVLEDNDGRKLILNGSGSSLIGKNGEKFPYVEFVEKHFLKTMPKSDTPKKILVIGAAGFTFGNEDEFNKYTFIDIDPDIQKVAETYFLKKKISPNKSFIGEDILAYLATSTEKYDLIFIDAYASQTIIPENLMTKEFFAKLKGALNIGGNLVANFVVSANFNDPMSRRLDNTFRSVYQHVNRQIVREDYNIWSDDGRDRVNVIYSYRQYAGEDDRVIYTRNKNTASFDRPNMKVE